MKFGKTHILGLSLAVMIIIFSYMFFYGTMMFYFLLVISFIAVVFPFVLSVFSIESKQKEREEKFLEFIRDLVENVRSGTPIVKSIINLQNRDYGTLSPHVSKLSNQLQLGISLEKAFYNFAIETNSQVIKRSVDLITEAQRAGGNITSILESISKSVNQTEILKKERKATVSNLVTQGYIIFMIFIIIMLVLEFRILPLVSELSSTEGLSVNTGNVNPDQFSTPLFVLIIVQSVFAGLVIGKISEGTIRRGIHHSFILLVITLLITTGAKAFFGKG